MYSNDEISDLTVNCHSLYTLFFIHLRIVLKHVIDEQNTADNIYVYMLHCSHYNLLMWAFVIGFIWYHVF